MKPEMDMDKRDGLDPTKHAVLSTYGAKSHAKSRVVSRDLSSSPTTPPVHRSYVVLRTGPLSTTLKVLRQTY